jgi:hypothetical protein
MLVLSVELRFSIICTAHNNDHQATLPMKHYSTKPSAQLAKCTEQYCMSDTSGDKNHLCGANLYESYNISLKDHAHGIDHHQRHGATVIIIVAQGST